MFALWTTQTQHLSRSRAAGFAGGWFTHKETQNNCYVLPAYTDTGDTTPTCPTLARK